MKLIWPIPESRQGKSSAGLPGENIPGEPGPLDVTAKRPDKPVNEKIEPSLTLLESLVSLVPPVVKNRPFEGCPLPSFEIPGIRI